MNSTEPDLQRRTVLAAAAALVVGAARGAERTFPSAGSPEFFEAYVRVRASLRDGPVFDHTLGSTFGVTDGESPRLLWFSEGLTESRYRRIAKDRVLGRMRYLGLMRDPTTGHVLDHFENPYSGETVEVPVSQHAADVGTIELTPSGTNYTQGGPTGPAPQPRVNGAYVSYTDRILLPLPAQAQPKLDVVTLTARLDEALDASRASVSSTLAFTGIERWRPWMRLGERPGGLLWHVTGARLSRSEVPAELLRRAQELWRAPLDAP